MHKKNLLHFDRIHMRDYFAQTGETSFHADQVLQWIHQQGHQHFEDMSNLSKTLRESLTKHAIIQPPEIICLRKSIDNTLKWLLKLQDDHCIEMVFIPEAKRGTLCISSQVGCALGCLFCATGKQGFKRNLSVAEIIGQVWLAARYLSTDNGKHDHHITNIVLMGMGEPLLNFDNVVKATNLMMDDLAYGLSKNRVTISTSGITPAIDKLSQESDVSLAVSLHAPNDELRSQLMPINKRYPLKELIAACKRFFGRETKRKIAFEYILLKNINDQPKHARELIKLLKNIPSKVNLIRYNPVFGSDYACSDEASLDTFQNILLEAGIRTITRKKRGEDIEAACGQLTGIKI